MKQIKVRAAMRRRERWIEQRGIGEEVASAFPAIGTGELSTNGWQAAVESLEGAKMEARQQRKRRARGRDQEVRSWSGAPSLLRSARKHSDDCQNVHEYLFIF